MTEKLVKSKGIKTQFELAGEFELSEFELSGFYCIFITFFDQKFFILTFLSIHMYYVVSEFLL